MSKEGLISLLPLLILIVAMYFLMIRPQKKKDKEIKEMRNSLQVGDEIVTIGGICGKIVKTKEETIVIQVGADKVKFEMMRWSVSKVVKKGSGHVAKSSVDDFDEVADAEEKEVIKSKPKRMKKAAPVEDAPAEVAPTEEVSEEPAESKE